MLGTMIPIWIMSIIVSAAMASTILLAILIPLLVFIDCVFAIPGVLLIIVGSIRSTCHKKTV